MKTLTAGAIIGVTMFAVGCQTLPDDAINLGDGKVFGVVEYDRGRVLRGLRIARTLYCTANIQTCQSTDIVRKIVELRERVAEGQKAGPSEAELLDATRGLASDVLRFEVESIAGEVDS